MTRRELFAQIKRKKSYLCVGLDTDITKIPSHLFSFDDPVFEFNKQIIDATKDYCIAYKPNLAFYESLGIKGLQSLEKTIKYIPGDCLKIADAKRGDIGNTSSLYAKAFFEYYQFDALTVNPYMGKDSVAPFLEFQDKWVIILALTSNEGSQDFQKLQIINSNHQGYFIFQQVLETSKQWGTENNMMYVIGATHADKLRDVRKIIPNHFLLIPGVGAQGGSLKEVSMAGMNEECGLIVNLSRQIIYASDKEDFAERAAEEAEKVQMEMKKYLSDNL